jgi:hypothetical protein
VDFWDKVNEVKYLTANEAQLEELFFKGYHQLDLEFPLDLRRFPLE